MRPHAFVSVPEVFSGADVRSETRYCRSCKKETRHDVEAITPVGEKIFIGIATGGLLPFLESMSAGSRFWGKRYTCQRCGEETEK